MSKPRANPGRSIKAVNTEKFQAPTVPPFADGLEGLRRTLIRHPYGLKHFDQKAGVGPLINAIVAYVLDQDVDVQARIAREGMRLYERAEEELMDAAIAGASPADGPPIPPPPAPTTGGQSDYHGIARPRIAKKGKGA